MCLCTSYLYTEGAGRMVQQCKEIAKRSSSACYYSTLANSRVQREAYFIFHPKGKIIISSNRNMAKWVPIINECLWKNAMFMTVLPTHLYLFGAVFNVLSIWEVLFFLLFWLLDMGTFLEKKDASQGLGGFFLCVFFSFFFFFLSHSWIMKRRRISGESVGPYGHGYQMCRCPLFCLLAIFYWRA